MGLVPLETILVYLVSIIKENVPTKFLASWSVGSAAQELIVAGGTGNLVAWRLRAKLSTT